MPRSQFDLGAEQEIDLLFIEVEVLLFRCVWT